MHRGRDDIRVKVRYPEGDRRQLTELDKVRIRTPQGSEVPLFTVADVEFGPGASDIKRTDGQRRVSVTAEIDSERANANEIFNALSSGYFDDLERRFPGATVALKGEKQKMRESIGSLFLTYPLALCGIYLIIATIFRSYIQPMIIMISVPFGIIGAIFGHILADFPISLMSIFGIVALSGVVVNDSIVLIDYINECQRSGVRVFDALRRGGGRRFRPIMLNTITTVIGLAPLLSNRDMQAQFLKPMALSIAAGVAFAAVLSLILIPCLLGMMNDGRRFFRYLRTGTWPTPEDVEPAYLEGRENQATPMPAAAEG